MQCHYIGLDRDSGLSKVISLPENLSPTEEMSICAIVLAVLMSPRLARWSNDHCLWQMTADDCVILLIAIGSLFG